MAAAVLARAALGRLGRLGPGRPRSTVAAAPARGWLPPAWALGGGLGAAGAGGYYVWYAREAPERYDGEAELVNWSHTHAVAPRRLYEPETVPELERTVAQAHRQGRKLRPVGNALSPNGLAFEAEGMVSLGLLDQVLFVDKFKRQVTVQAGASVGSVLKALAPYGLTLQNLASIAEQQVGGFVQVGAHGTGATLPTVDDTVVSMKLVTPAKGTIELSQDSDPELFKLAKVGLGALGVVSEVTLQCVPQHRLLEHTFVTTPAAIKKNHARWLKENKHLRYMWIPYTGTVVAVACNDFAEGQRLPLAARLRRPRSDAYKLVPLLDLLEAESGGGRERFAGLSFADLRDQLIKLNPLDKDWIVRVNRAEAEFWKRNQGYAVGDSGGVLGFDCGGQQWVHEVGFPTGSLERSGGQDLAYMEELLKCIEARGIPAPAPLEQRWTSTSSSALSVGSHPDPEEVHSWVGVIMYLPSDDEAERAAITAAFGDYCAHKHEIDRAYGAWPHWAKIEMPATPEGVAEMKEAARRRFPVREFAAARRELDPKGILANALVEELFGVEE